MLCWQSYSHGGTRASVPRYLEQHAERLRARYLAFIHELGELRIGEQRIIDHLDLGDGFSFWWMTRVAEKSPLKSPRIYDCLRLLALEEMLETLRPASLRLIGADRDLARAVRQLCSQLKIRFIFDASSPEKHAGWARRLYSAMPHPVKGLLSFRHIVRRWPLRRARPRSEIATESDLLICSYFIHLDAALCRQGHFHSRQWESLPELLQQAGRRVSWIQLFLYSAVVPDVRTATDWVTGFNREALSQGSHTFLESYLTAIVAWRAAKQWLKLNVVRLRLRRIAASFYGAGSRAWLWPLLREDWQASLSGTVAVTNCVAVQLFDAALAHRSRQSLGLYLYENQPWEKALLRAWRKYGHGEIIGVQHSTAPFWHLYNFQDPRSLARGQPCALPQPDRLAINGMAARNLFEAAGYPAERLLDVEALRYIALSGLAEQRGATQSGGLSTPSETAPRKVLILGDLMPASMDYLMNLVENTLELLQVPCEFTLKPHPGNTPELPRFARLQVSLTSEPLWKILGRFDAAIAANTTSAAVDAYVAGLPVIVALDGGSFNMSPLRGEPGTHFAGTPRELADALLEVSGARSVASSHQSAFFFLDPQLPRWRRLLSLAA